MKPDTAREQDSQVQGESSEIAGWRRAIKRLPLTLRPANNQQLARWKMLFPFEQKRLRSFLEAVVSFSPEELNRLTAPVRDVEWKMGVRSWDFSEAAETMGNASLLSRSQYFVEWRRAVQTFFEAVEARAEANAKKETQRGRLMVLVLPENLPVDPRTVRDYWKPRGNEVAITGNVRELYNLLTGLSSSQPRISDLLTQQGSTDPSDFWVIDGDTRPSETLPPVSGASCLRFAALKPMREQFLDSLNAIPKDIGGADQVVAVLRQSDWTRWCPPELARQPRLLNFMVEVFLSGNGSLNFASAFVEWTASEAIRRARPRVVIARFGMRSKPKPFTSIAIFSNQDKVSTLPSVDDPENSAVDAVVLADYVWLAARGYPEYQQSLCLCVSERLNAAWVVAPRAIGMDGLSGTLSSSDLYHSICSWLAS